MKSSVKDNKVILEFQFNKIDEDLISLLSSIEIGEKSQASENDILDLSNEIKKEWWEKNKRNFILDE